MLLSASLIRGGDLIMEVPTSFDISECFAAGEWIHANQWHRIPVRERITAARRQAEILIYFNGIILYLTQNPIYALRGQLIELAAVDIKEATRKPLINKLEDLRKVPCAILQIWNHRPPARPSVRNTYKLRFVSNPLKRSREFRYLRSEIDDWYTRQEFQTTTDANRATSAECSW